MSLEITRTENRPLTVVLDAVSPRSAFTKKSFQTHHTRFEQLGFKSRANTAPAGGIFVREEDLASRQICALSVRFCGRLFQINQYRVGHVGASEFLLNTMPSVDEGDLFRAFPFVPSSESERPTQILVAH